MTLYTDSEDEVEGRAAPRLECLVERYGIAHTLAKTEGVVVRAASFQYSHEPPGHECGIWCVAHFCDGCRSFGGDSRKLLDGLEAALLQECHQSLSEVLV